MIDLTSTLRGLTRLANRRVHLGVTGSVACYKAAELLRDLLACQVHVSATLTDAAGKFVTPLLFRSLGAMPVYGAMFEDGEDPFAHLEPGQHADALLIAPASADTLARVANGAASDMLSAQVLAFDGPVLAAPAMNSRMWRSAATQENVTRLAARGVTIVTPASGAMACGDVGQGRLAPLPVLLAFTLRAVAPKDLAGRTALVTMGCTREPWDGVRVWTNPSTGAMGAALAMAAWLRGASVIAVAGPSVSDSLLPAGIEGVTRVNVGTAREMFEACDAAWDTCDMGMFSAAVADFSPVRYGATKFKKAGRDTFTVDFTPNPDILKTLAARRRPDQKVLGFAAETASSDEELMALARVKLEGKRADVVAANNVAAAGSGFGTATNTMAVVARDGSAAAWPAMSKADVAWDLCTWLSRQ